MVDLNDRALRHVNVGLGGPLNGIPREDGFDITVASEIMAILCLATDINDLKERLANIVVAYRYDRTPVYVRDLEIEGALTLILKDAIKPNLVQTIYGTPALVHGGPFANIAHGCNSVLATATALRLADYTITEAGFGADLGAEKFLDIKTPNLPTTPDAVVIVATLRALKMHGGVAKTDLSEENVQAVRDGFANLKRHVENVRKFGLPAVVAINEFVADTEAEIAALKELCAEIDVPVELASVWANGADGGIDLANAVVDAVEMVMPTINVFILMMIAWKKKSLRLLLKSMVVNQLSSRKKLRTNSNNLQNSVGINCQYVWLKHNIASQITNSYLEHQKVLISLSVNLFLKQVLDLS